jgi:hypothetical protein
MSASLCIANFSLVVDKMQQEARGAVDEVTEEIFRTSRDVFCPVDTGDLKGSGENNTIENNSLKYTRQIKFGNEKVFYAPYVHEIPYNHYNPAGASWKFLSIPFNMLAPSLEKKIEYRLHGIL